MQTISIYLAVCVALLGKSTGNCFSLLDFVKEIGDERSSSLRLKLNTHLRYLTYFLQPPSSFKLY